MVTPTWSWLLTKWSLQPSVAGGVGILTVAYLYTCGFRFPWTATSQRRPRLCTTGQLTMFIISVGILIVALLSPLDYVGDSYLFSAHMIQHLLLASVWPPVLLLSLPESAIAPIFSRARLPRFLRSTTLPAVAFLLFNVDLAVWHLPAWYDLTLQNGWVHILEHVSFMALGLLVWWPILSPLRQQRLSFGMQELYLFASLFPMMGLGILFSFYQHPLYSPYVADPRLWGMSPVTDQQIGGLIMWMPGNASYALAMAGILTVWFDRGDPHEQQQVQVGAAKGSL